MSIKSSREVLKVYQDGSLFLEKRYKKDLWIVLKHPIGFIGPEEFIVPVFKGFEYKKDILTAWRDNEKEELIGDFLTEVIEFNNDGSPNDIRNAEILIELINTYMNIEKEKGIKNVLLIDVLGKCAEVFSRKTINLNAENILGLFGELILILKLEKLGINASSWYHSDDNMQYDLYVKKLGKYIEVKTSQIKNLVKVKDHQLENKRDYTLLIKVDVTKDDNGANLSDLINELITLKIDPIFHDKIISYLDESKKSIIAEETRFDIESIDFRIFKCSDLPKIEIKKSDRIKNISYDIDLVELESYDLKDILEILK